MAHSHLLILQLVVTEESGGLADADTNGKPRYTVVLEVVIAQSAQGKLLLQEAMILPIAIPQLRKNGTLQKTEKSRPKWYYPKVIKKSGGYVIVGMNGKLLLKPVLMVTDALIAAVSMLFPEKLI